MRTNSLKTRHLRNKRSKKPLHSNSSRKIYTIRHGLNLTHKRPHIHKSVRISSSDISPQAKIISSSSQPLPLSSTRLQSFHTSTRPLRNQNIALSTYYKQLNCITNNTNINKRLLSSSISDTTHQSLSSSSLSHDNEPQFAPLTPATAPYHTTLDLLGATRTHYISDLDSLPPDTPVTITGWVHRIRKMSHLFFIVLRDNTGLVQCTLEAAEVPAHLKYYTELAEQQQQQQQRRQQQQQHHNDTSSSDASTTTTTPLLDMIDMNTIGNNAYNAALSTTPESVVSIKGVVASRPLDMIKKDQTLGACEVRIRSYRVLNPSEPTPIPLHDAQGTASEDQRMQYRFIDLRREANTRIIKARSQLAMAARQCMYHLGFHEIETPALVKSTPEGAREFLVPSRSKGKFYALPQSPQQHKQLLMASGFDKYFQVARCFRDESGRQDRQPEFTQLDLEMSYVNEHDVMNVVESMVNAMHIRSYGVPMANIQRVSYKTCLDRFGSDKPDLRYQCELYDLTNIFINAMTTCDQDIYHRLIGYNHDTTTTTTTTDDDHTPSSHKPSPYQTTQHGIISQSSLSYITPDNITDPLISSLLTVYPQYINAAYSLKQHGSYGQYRRVDDDGTIKLSVPSTSIDYNNDSGTTTSNSTSNTHILKPLARHPFPVIKMVIARDLNDKLSGRKGKPLVENMLRACSESSNGLSPVIVSCNKWKTRNDHVILSLPSVQETLTQQYNLQPNDMLFILSGSWEDVCNGLGKIRTQIHSLLPESSPELQPAIINGKQVLPAQRPLTTAPSLTTTPPHTTHSSLFHSLVQPYLSRFPSILIPSQWKMESSMPIDKQTPLNTTGPLPTFHWVCDFPLFEPLIPQSVYYKASHHTTSSSSSQQQQQQQQSLAISDSLLSSNERVVINAMHHPFTAPHPADMHEFEQLTRHIQPTVTSSSLSSPTSSSSSEPTEQQQSNNDIFTGYPLTIEQIQQLSQIRALHYDLVSNGLEVGGGSIRLHNATQQRKVFDVLQVPHHKFDHLLRALEQGCPPHGGFAAGLDRLVSILTSEHDTPRPLRDVIAFPKSGTGNDLLLGSPNEQTQQQLDEYHINIRT